MGVIVLIARCPQVLQHWWGTRKFPMAMMVGHNSCRNRRRPCGRFGMPNFAGVASGPIRFSDDVIRGSSNSGGLAGRYVRENVGSSPTLRFTVPVCNRQIRLSLVEQEKMDGFDIRKT